jgi:outer membrane protein assembly factor BamB
MSGSEKPASGWKIPFWGTTSSPVLAGGLLYAGSGDGAIYALDPSSGAIRWRFQTGEGLLSGPEIVTVRPGASAAEMLGTGSGQMRRGRKEVAATPVVDKGTVFVGSRDYSFYAVDAATGQKKWSFQTGGEIYKQATTHGNNVLFTSADGFLHAVDVNTGERKWAFKTVTGVRKLAPRESIVKDEVVYLTNESFLYAIDAASGLEKWRFIADGGFASSPREADGRIFFSVQRHGSRFVILYSVDASSGKVIWQFDAESEFFESDPVIAVRDMVLVGTDRGLFALDRKTGLPRWSRLAENREIYGLFHADDRLLYLAIPNPDGKVLALDPETGEVKWSSSPGGSSPFGRGDRVVRKIDAILGDTIYATGYGYLYALHRDTGQEMWSIKVEWGIHGAPLIVAGMVYIPGITVIRAGYPPLVGSFFAIDAATGKLRP